MMRTADARRLASRAGGRALARAFYRYRRRPLRGFDAWLDGEVRGRALVSYLPGVLRGRRPPTATHQNVLAARAIANALNRCGYIVDVVSFGDPLPAGSVDYDLIFGLEPAFVEGVRQRRGRSRAIYYATGAYWQVQNANERRRLDALEARRGTRLQPRRQVVPHTGPEVADAVIYVGNHWVRETYADVNANLCGVTECGFPGLPPAPLASKDYEGARRRFFWLGSTGMVHKGLDLVLEAFADSPDLELVVCGPVHREEDFVTLYERELFQLPNIRTEGWIDLSGDRYRSILRQAGHILYPSCSEGQAGSVVAALCGGLPAIVTEQAGIEPRDGVAILAGDNVEDIAAAIHVAAEGSAAHLRDLSHYVAQDAAGRYTVDRFESQLVTAFSELDQR